MVYLVGFLVVSLLFELICGVVQLVQAHRQERRTYRVSNVLTLAAADGGARERVEVVVEVQGTAGGD